MTKPNKESKQVTIVFRTNMYISYFKKTHSLSFSVCNNKEHKTMSKVFDRTNFDESYEEFIEAGRDILGFSDIFKSWREDKPTFDTILERLGLTEKIDRYRYFERT